MGLKASVDDASSVSIEIIVYHTSLELDLLDKQECWYLDV